MLSVTTEQVQKIASSANPDELFETARLLALIRKEAAQPGAGQIQMLIESLDESFSEKTASLSDAWNASKTHILSGLAGATLAGGTGYAMASKLPNESDEEFGARRRRLALTAGAGGAAVGAALPTAMKMTGMDERLQTIWNRNKPLSMRQRDFDAATKGKTDPSFLIAQSKRFDVKIPEPIAHAATVDQGFEKPVGRALVGAAGGAIVSEGAQALSKNRTKDVDATAAAGRATALKTRQSDMQNDPYVGAKGVGDEILMKARLGPGGGIPAYKAEAGIQGFQDSVSKAQQAVAAHTALVAANPGDPTHAANLAAAQQTLNSINSKANQLKWNTVSTRLAAVKAWIDQGGRPAHVGGGTALPMPPEVHPELGRIFTQKQRQAANAGRRAMGANVTPGTFGSHAIRTGPAAAIGAVAGWTEPMWSDKLSKLWPGSDKTPKLK